MPILLFAYLLFFETPTSFEIIEPVENEKLQLTISIPTEGNSWVINDLGKNNELIGKDGIKNWTDPQTIIRTWFKVEQTGKLNVGILAKSVSGSSTIKITCGSKSENIEVANTAMDTLSVGTFEIKEKGYHFIEIQGVKKDGDYFYRR